jgi:hypothetical protein
MLLLHCIRKMVSDSSYDSLGQAFACVKDDGFAPALSVTIVGTANPNRLQCCTPEILLSHTSFNAHAQESRLAYSLNDVYRFLRVVMRIDGVIVGFGLGLLLAIASRSALADWGVYAGGPVWPVRLAGGLLITLGVMLILSAQERIIGGPSMVAMSLGNAVIALVLLLAYLQ